MKKSEYEIYMYDDPARGHLCIQIVDVANDTIARPVNMVFEPIAPHTIQGPAISIIYQANPKGFIKAMAKALENRGEIKKQEPAEVSAIKYHLEDMRVLAGVTKKKLKEQHSVCATE